MTKEENPTFQTGDRDCEELKKEVERLKVLIKQRERSAHYSFYSHVSKMTDSQIENQFKQLWETFKNQNNL